MQNMRSASKMAYFRFFTYSRDRPNHGYFPYLPEGQRLHWDPFGPKSPKNGHFDKSDIFVIFSPPGPRIPPTAIAAYEVFSKNSPFTAGARNQ